jgi:hypothetical protein
VLSSGEQLHGCTEEVMKNVLATLWLGKKVRKKSENKVLTQFLDLRRMKYVNSLGYYMTRNFLIFACHFNRTVRIVNLGSCFDINGVEPLGFAIIQLVLVRVRS